MIDVLCQQKAVSSVQPYMCAVWQQKAESSVLILHDGCALCQQKAAAGSQLDSLMEAMLIIVTCTQIWCVVLSAGLGTEYL